MKTLKLFMAVALAVCLFACNHQTKVERPNTNAIWLWGSHMMEAPIAEWAEKGYGHILLNEAAFSRWGEDTVFAFINDCEKLGLTVHVWFQAFYDDGKWICPVDDQTQLLNQDYYTKVVNRAVEYAKKGVDGIHLDYIRYGGTAYKHDYPECRATYQITEFCRQLNEAVKPINPDIILSAALMPEINSEYYYGQNPLQMGKYLDILMPMVYRYGYAGEDKPLSWVKEVCNWFAANSGGAQVWAGIQTYTLDLTRTNEHPIEMCADSILADCKDIVNTNAHGLVLFRHGLGEFPDVKGLWDNKPVESGEATSPACNDECNKITCNLENCDKDGALGYVTASTKSVPVKEFAIAIQMYNTILVDVRTEKEHKEGFIPGTHYNLNVLDDDFEQKALNTLCRCKNVAIYCRSGNRSKKAMEILYKNGYNVIELASGTNGWIEAEKELTKE